MIIIHLVGPANGGKSALLKKYMSDQYSDKKVPTHGVAIDFRCSVKLHAQDMKIEIIDAAGECEGVGVKTGSFDPKTAVFLFVFDLTNSNPFARILEYLKVIRAQNAQSKVLLIGSKADAVIASNVIPESAIKKILRDYSIDDYVAVSAKKGMNVSLAFRKSFALALNCRLAPSWGSTLFHGAQKGANGSITERTPLLVGSINQELNEMSTFLPKSTSHTT